MWNLFIATEFVLHVDKNVTNIFQNPFERDITSKLIMHRGFTKVCLIGD